MSEPGPSEDQILAKIEEYNKALSNVAEYACIFKNRGRCYTLINEYEKAMDDFETSVKLNKRFIKGYIGLIRCYIAAGKIAEAEKNIKIVVKLDPNNSHISTEQSKLDRLKTAFSEAKFNYDKKNYAETIAHLNKIIKISDRSAAFRNMKAECLIFLKRFEEAHDVAVQILNTIDKKNLDAMCNKGISFYYMDKMEQAFANFQYVLNLKPNHTKTISVYLKAKLISENTRKGRECFKAGQLNEAYDFFSTALKIDPFNDGINCRLLYNRATVSYQMGKINQSLKDCCYSLNLDGNYVNALLRRAKCFSFLEDYEKAVLDLEKAYSIDGTESTKKLLDEAKLNQNNCSKYDILGMPKDAPFAPPVHHPDRQVNTKGKKRKQKKEKPKAKSDPYEKAILDLEKAYSIDGTESTKKLLDEAKSNQNNCPKYDILGMPKDAPFAPPVHHPDRQVNTKGKKKKPKKKKPKAKSDPVENSKKNTFQKPVILYFWNIYGSLKDEHCNLVVQKIKKKFHCVKSRYYKKKNYGLAAFSDRKSAEKALLMEPWKIKIYSIKFSKQKKKQ